MIRRLLLAAACTLIALAVAGVGPLPATAKDLGVQGALFPINETDIMAFLAARLQAAKASGKADQLNRAFAARAKQSLMLPPAVEGLVTTRSPRTWLFDPTYVVPQDIADQNGRVFAHAGQVVNPLQAMPDFDRVYVFIDGDDPRQVALGMAKLRKTGPTRTRVILVKGSPVELMRTEKTPLYFDQAGIMSTRFGLHQVPAVVVREGDKLRISEVAP